jgi:hypothetical protein
MITKKNMSSDEIMPTLREKKELHLILKKYYESMKRVKNEG